MTRFLCVLVFIMSASSAMAAQEIFPEENCIRYINHLQSGIPDEYNTIVLMIDGEPTNITFNIKRAWGNDPDMLTILDWPDGYIPVPMSVVVDEHSSVTICIVPYIGG
jgi:hypothetical protein